MLPDHSELKMRATWRDRVVLIALVGLVIGLIYAASLPAVMRLTQDSAKRIPASVRLAYTPVTTVFRWGPLYGAMDNWCQVWDVDFDTASTGQAANRLDFSTDRDRR